MRGPKIYTTTRDLSDDYDALCITHTGNDLHYRQEQVCGWSYSGDRKDAIAESKKHLRETGHTWITIHFTKVIDVTVADE